MHHEYAVPALRLARAYRTSDEDDRALAVCDDNLKLDQDTLNAIAMQILAGNIWLDRGDNQRALGIFDAMRESEQGVRCRATRWSMNASGV